MENDGQLLPSEVEAVKKLKRGKASICFSAFSLFLSGLAKNQKSSASSTSDEAIRERNNDFWFNLF